MGVSIRHALAGGLLALLLVAGALVLLVLRPGGQAGEAAEPRHDELTAWLTCHGHLRERIPEATLTLSPWESARRHVRREEDTYSAAGTTGLRDDPQGAVRFECVVEWRGDGWTLISLDAAIEPAADS